jgi:hypothetical protein
MLNQIRRIPDERILILLPDFDAVIRNKTMAAFDELQRRFTFTDAAFSRYEHADAVYIHKHAVNGGCRRETALKKIRQPA